MKQLLILILIVPTVIYCQPDNIKYECVIDYVVDSIIKNDNENYYISSETERKTDFVDFHGLSTNCEIQHQLLLEILLKGDQSDINESDLYSLIPEKFKDNNRIIKLEFSSIISYKNIWATVVTKRDLSTKKKEWVTYSLIFIDKKLIGEMIGKWHGD